MGASSRGLERSIELPRGGEPEASSAFATGTRHVARRRSSDLMQGERAELAEPDRRLGHPDFSDGPEWVVLG